VVLRICGLLVSASLAAVGAVTSAGSFPGLLAALVVLGFGLGAVDATMGMQGIAVQGLVRRNVMASFYAWWSLATILGALAASAAAATPLSLFAFFAAVAAVLIGVQLVAGSRLLRTATADMELADPLAASAAVP
jgi:hypothetical protein